MSTPGMVLNLAKNEAFSVAKEAVDWFTKKDIEFYIEKEAASFLGEQNRAATYKELREKADYIIVFGGDGTFLHTSHHFIGSGVPLLGINIGQLGFLTDIETEELEKALQMVTKKEYKIEHRMMIKAEHFRDGKKIERNYALNDYVVNRSPDSRMVKIKLYINDELVNRFRSDGLIISTPTGSTAYSLSAGGPIINPRQVRAILITPICPHNLHMRPMVISGSEKICIEIEGDSGSIFGTADGHDNSELLSGDKIYIEAADREISIIKLPDRTFYTILKEKMNLA
ncbi:MAG: NAD(+)/NADH kinase [Bacillota bacterium]